MTKRQRWGYVYVVVRVDGPLSIELGEVEWNLRLKSAHPTEDEAQAEVERLRKLPSAEGSAYFWKRARYYPRGIEADRQEPGSASERLSDSDDLP